jgi:hypothetical protein
MGRPLDIDGLNSAGLDARAIVLGSCAEPASPALGGPATPTTMWEGTIIGDGTGPQRSYFVLIWTWAPALSRGDVVHMSTTVDASAGVDGVFG